LGVFLDLKNDPGLRCSSCSTSRRSGIDISAAPDGAAVAKDVDDELKLELELGRSSAKGSLGLDGMCDSFVGELGGDC